jgi:xanthocillin biosynthesis cytochrome P450 monooxygenase
MSPSQGALDSGHLEQYQANLRMMFMVGHDNIEFLLTSAMWELGTNTVR